MINEEPKYFTVSISFCYKKRISLSSSSLLLLAKSNSLLFCGYESISILIATSDPIQPRQLIKSLYDFRSFQFHFRHPAIWLCAALQSFDLRHAQVWVISESFTQLKNFQVWNSPTQSINNWFRTTATAAAAAFQEKTMKKKFAASCEL